MSRHTYKKTKLQLCRIKADMDGSLCVTSATSLSIYVTIDGDYYKFTYCYQGRIQDFKLGGAHLNFFWGISCEKSRFYAKKSYFSNFRGGGAREIFGVFHVKNHDFTPKKSYFYQF